MRRVAILVAVALALSACGKQTAIDGSAREPAQAQRVETTRVELVERVARDEGFDPQQIYRLGAPGVVTVSSVFDGDEEARGARGQGSGFVVSGEGEILTNAHVVTSGEGESLERADEVYVEFDDLNRVVAEISGVDPNADIALLRLDPAGLSLRPLPLGSSDALEVGEPVAAIGSPFGEPQSLSLGVISGLDRTIDSLTGFAIFGAIQTDAAINRGNSGGPLVGADGAVVGVNSQIRTTGGGNEGVGFAVPVDTVKRSLNELRESGRVGYGFLGVATTRVYPQLAERFDLPVQRGALVQEVTPGSPAAGAGLRAGDDEQRFQGQPVRVGGDLIASVEGRRIRDEEDLARVISALDPGERIEIVYYRDAARRTAQLELASRPAGT